MKTNIRPNTKIAAFSMIEMIGVLAVIAILAALLIPKVFDAINSAKINNTASGLNTVKTAVVTHFGKWGALNCSNGITFPVTDAQAKLYGSNVLVGEKFLDKPFETKIGTGGCIELVAATAAATTPPDGLGANYWLSGQGTDPVNETSPASMIVQARLFNVAIADAMELSRCIDGPTMSYTDLAVADLKGRVQYKAPVAGVTDVFVYMESK